MTGPTTRQPQGVVIKETPRLQRYSRLGLAGYAVCMSFAAVGAAELMGIFSAAVLARRSWTVAGIQLGTAFAVLVVAGIKADITVDRSLRRLSTLRRRG
jgi:hypothetical protein